MFVLQFRIIDSLIAFQDQDLGGAAHSSGSGSGCGLQEGACWAVGGCGRHGRCVGGTDQPFCLCDPGEGAPYNT